MGYLTNQGRRGLKRWLGPGGGVFALVFTWKVLLVWFFALPVPANDAFFYDGPVVNELVSGRYVNPSLAAALPISGTQVFSAYPPLYQAVLIGWMYLFGTSALSAIVLHLILFGVYMLILLAIFRRLEVPTVAVQVAGALLLSITFHDRPDTLAHVFGMAAVYAGIRATRSGGWAWAMAGCAVLTLGTSLQVGALYFLLLCGPTLGAAWATQSPASTPIDSKVEGIAEGRSSRGRWLPASLSPRACIPLAALLVVIVVSAALVGLIRFRFPHLWLGFTEHAQQTPSFTGWRLPRLAESLKVFRTVPGVMLVVVLLPWFLRLRARQGQVQESVFAVRVLEANGSSLLAHAEAKSYPREGCDPRRARLLSTVTWASALSVLAISAGALCLLTPNAVLFAGQLQPLVVGTFLALGVALGCERKRLRQQTHLFVAMAAIGSIRAVGMTTWGAACGLDVGYPAALRCVETELETCKAGGTVVLSSSYLYQAARHQELTWIHSDWMEPARRGESGRDWEGLLALKPSRIILTQFDYYRRYAPLLAQLEARPDLAQVERLNTAHIPAPDSSPVLQKVVQHVSWAPVVVRLSWK